MSCNISESWNGNNISNSTNIIKKKKHNISLLTRKHSHRKKLMEQDLYNMVLVLSGLHTVINTLGYSLSPMTPYSVLSLGVAVVNLKERRTKKKSKDGKMACQSSLSIQGTMAEPAMQVAASWPAINHGWQGTRVKGGRAASNSVSDYSAFLTEQRSTKRAWRIEVQHRLFSLQKTHQ